MSELVLGQLIHKSEHTPGIEVYQAEYQGQPVIAKTNPNPEQLDAEAAVLRSVNSRRIPALVGRVDDWLLSEPMSGLPLSKIINLTPDWKSQPIESKRTLQIVKGLARCFQDLIRAGYCYRDLNLDHVIVDGDDVSLVDHEWDVPTTNAIVDGKTGTWETMAPEEFIQGGRMTEASNVYTLGVVVVQLETLRNPFHVRPSLVPQTDQRQMASCELRKTPTSANISNPLFHDAVLAALEFDQSRRTQSIADFVGGLE